MKHRRYYRRGSFPVLAWLFIFGFGLNSNALGGEGQSPEDIPDELTGIINPVNEHIAAGDYHQAEKLAGEMLKTSERTLGPDSLEVSRVLDVLVEALLKGGEAKEGGSRELAERAVMIKKLDLMIDKNGFEELFDGLLIVKSFCAEIRCFCRQ